MTVQQGVARITGRERWIDILKGIAIMGVVLFHSVSLADGTVAHGAWVGLALGLFTWIMPTFFIASGLVFHSSLSLGWPEFLRRRIWPLAYLWLVWSLGFAALHKLTSGVVGNTLGEGVALHTVLWYLPALATHMVAARALRSVDASIQLGLATLLAAPIAVLFPLQGWGLAHTPHFFVFFLVGIYCRRSVTLLASVWRLRTLGCLVITGIVLGAVATLVPDSLRVVYALAPLVAVPAVLIVAHAFDSIEPVGNPFAYVGTATVAIFLTHPLVLQLLGWGPTAAFLPLVALAIAVAVGLLAWRDGRNVPGVFTPPSLARIHRRANGSSVA